VLKSPQASKGHTKNSLPNSGIVVSFIILVAQIINVTSNVLYTQTPYASSIQIKSIRQKKLDDVVDITPQKNNYVGRP
jgi:hypothetical protein